MEKLNKIIKKTDVHIRRLQRSSQSTSQLIRKDGFFEVSIYSGELTTEFMIQSTAKLKKSFPALPIEFFDIFSDRVKENGFSDNRLKDSINHVIDTCIYPTPTIAQFISYDKSVKLYSYDDIVKKNDQNKGAFDRYKAVQIKNHNKPYWASVQDIENYNMKPFKK